MERKLLIFPTAGGLTFAWLYGLLLYAPKAREVLLAELGRVVRHEPSPLGQDPEIRSVVLDSLELWEERKQKALKHGGR